MADWRSRILQEFVPRVASLTLVADPDGLLFEEGVLAGIRQRGFEILEFEDPIEFRFALAGKHRAILETEAAPEIVVACRRPAFLDTTAAQSGKMAKEAAGPDYHCQIPGPLNLPFDHDDVRVYVDNLFLEGLLNPVEFVDAKALGRSWTRVGIRSDPVSDRQRRFTGLVAKLADSVPGAEARHDEWMQFGQRWAELTALRFEPGSKLPSEQAEAHGRLQETVDTAFGAWLLTRYAGLHNQPADPPVMLQHVPRVMARHIDGSPSGKAALVVVDGLALDQWVALRDVIQAQQPDLTIREHAVFAWIPTVTALSRQAVFAGKAPLFFPSSIHTTDREPAFWNQFWVDHGLTRRQVGYAKGLGSGDMSRVEELVENPALRVVGLVVDTVDKIMHGMALGSAGMHNLVRQWAAEGFMTKLIQLLLRYGFRIYLTSDHGNLEATGCGRPTEGSVADLRGERVRVYPENVLRASVHSEHPGAVEWPGWGLPSDYLPLLLAGARRAFVKTGDRVVCHGGTSIEEVLVPFVEIDRSPA